MVGGSTTVLPTTTNSSGDYTMDHPPMLTDVLKLHFAGWPLARIKCLASLMAGVFKVKTVHLTQMAPTFPGHAEIESH
jgi:hypothetical protein